MIAEQNAARRDLVLLCRFLDLLLLEQWAACAAKGTVCSDEDTLLLAELDNVMLREVGVVFDLIHCRGDLDLREELFQKLDGQVANSNGLCLSGLEQLLHFLPSLDPGPVGVEIARAIWELGCR